MKVLLYSSTSRTGPGGVQGVYAAVARGLRRRGHDVTEGWADPSTPPDPDEWTVPLHAPVAWRGALRPRSAAASGWSVARLLRDLWRLRPDVVHIHFVRPEVLYFLLLRPLLGHRVVLTFHGTDFYHLNRVSRRLLPLLVRHADAVTAVSAPIQERLQRLVGEGTEIRFVPNGIDVDAWASGARRTPAVPTVVAVGRLEPVKGFDVLAEAVRRIQETSEVRLHLVGDGVERDALERQVAEAGLTESVTFAGSLDAAGVRDAYREATVFALPSRSEGLPLVALEAMASGLPVVASRVGGVPDVVTPDAGTLVEPEDPEALAEALRSYLTSPGRAASAGQAGRELVQGYSVEAMVDAYERLYEVALTERPATPSGDGGLNWRFWRMLNPE